MVIRKHDYTTIKELDEKVGELLGHPENSAQWAVDLQDLLMLRGELEMSLPAYEPRHRA